MPRQHFIQTLQSELERIGRAKTTKRFETVIEGFTKESSPKALIDARPYRIFNSNDYLGFRFHPKLKAAEHKATEEFGTGPGAVRFISGSLKVHLDLEKAIAAFHGRDDAIVFSSAFGSGAGLLALVVSRGFAKFAGTFSRATSSGSSMWTAPGFSSSAVLNAVRTIAGMLLESMTLAASFVMGFIVLTTSIN